MSDVSDPLFERKVTVKKLWRCPHDGMLYERPDTCHLRCWARKGGIEHHQPVTRTTTVEVQAGHDD